MRRSLSFVLLATACSFTHPQRNEACVGLVETNGCDLAIFETEGKCVRSDCEVDELDSLVHYRDCLCGTDTGLAGGDCESYIADVTTACWDASSAL